MKESASTPLPRLDGIRVLVLFGGSDLFGQERANLEVFRHLAQLGLQARFITNRKWGWREIQPELDRLGFEWTTAPFGYHWGKYILGRYFYYFFLNLYGVAATSLRLWHEARRWKPTHFYVMNSAFFTFAAPALLALRQPLIYRAGDLLPTHSAFHRWIGRRLLRRLKALVCNSHFLEHRFRASAPRGLAVKVIHNYPPSRAGIAAGALVKVPIGAVVLVYIGQMAEHKGVHLLVKAASEIIRGGRNLALLLAGECKWGGTLAARLQAQVRGEELEERIQFLGHVEDVPGLLRQAHIHACPSVWDEPSPNVIMEAKHEGVPSVVFASGGIPELIEHGMDGYICRAPTAEALAEGIEYFATDPVVRQQAGAAARRSLDEKFGEIRFQRDWASVFVDSVGD